MRQGRAFTLLELLLAVTLSAILMVGVLGVVSNLGSLATAEPEPVAGDASLEAFLRLLGDDLRHADTIDASRDDRLRMEGPLGLDEASRARVHRPVEVEYALRDVAGRRWVVRRQAWLDELTNDNVQVDLVATGVASFALRGEAFAPASVFPPDPMLLRDPREIAAGLLAESRDGDADDDASPDAEAADDAPAAPPDVEPVSDEPLPSRTAWTVRIVPTASMDAARDDRATLGPVERLVAITQGVDE